MGSYSGFMSDKLVIFFYSNKVNCIHPLSAYHFYGYHCIAILLTLETVSENFLFWQTALQGVFQKYLMN